MTMRPVGLTICLLLALSPAAIAREQTPQKPLIVTLIKVDDGDSFAAYDSSGQRHRIRLAAIDAPERAQRHGRAAGRHLNQLLASKRISVFTRKKDRYKRWVARVVVDGANVGLLQVKAGHAWHYKKYAHEQPGSERAAFKLAEAKARETRVGLWQYPDPLAPWQWRRNKRK